MRGEKFWKGVTVFCLAFGAGFFIAKPFVPDEKAPETTVSDITPTLKNCVSVDGEPQYDYLGAEEKKVLAASKDEAGKSETGKTPATGRSEKQFYGPARDGGSYQILLYRERCFQSGDSK